MRGNMDTVYTADDFHSMIVSNLTATRLPFVRHTRADVARIAAPYVMTEGGIVFGLPAIVDFLLNRVPEPPLLYPDIRRRALQMTVFWALIDREYPKLIDADSTERYRWLRAVEDQLRCNRFYTGNELSICDIAMCALLDTLRLFMHGLPQTHHQYVQRCSEAFVAISDRNKQVLNDDGA